MDMTSYISVILPIKLDWEPCYSVPPAVRQTSGKVSAGDRVRVIFAGREYVGAVSSANITPQVDISRIKPIIAVEKNLESISHEEIELWRMMADYYLCTIGEVYRAAYPTTKTKLETAKAAAQARSEERAQLKAAKDAEAIRIRIMKMTARLEKKTVMLNKARKESTKEAYLSEINDLTDAVRHKESELQALERQANMLAAGNTAGDHGAEADPAGRGAIILSQAQEQALMKINDAFSIRKTVLLNGLTGSGKTEIYMKLAMETMRNGRNVLYLVPEIAISRQLEDRLRSHFGDSLLIFHSGETAAGKRSTADAIRKATGSADSRTEQHNCPSGTSRYIAIGTRSAIFLPHRELGLIIVDEEHDSSYKQDSPAPRYNGRDTAIMLAQIHSTEDNNCNVILGSATPSLEEIYNCSKGKHIQVILAERYHSPVETLTEIIDTKAERRKRGMTGSFSRKLIDHINCTLSDKGQVIILRSRRAWAPALQCENCGDIPKCPHCNVSLSLHNPYTGDGGEQETMQKTAGVHMACHHCGHKTEFSGTCMKCGGKLGGIGAGTQKIEEEAAKLFPLARIARLDSDTNHDRNKTKKTIRDFSDGKIDILIGTQMVAKGFDFSNLRSVAVIGADSLLGAQDFRADEKAMQLLEQFRGRCGRRGERGLFIIQTSQPEHPVYRRIAGNEATAFNTELLRERMDFNYPPFTRIVELTVRDTDEIRAEKTAQMLAMRMRAGQGLDTESCNGPQESRLPEITGPYSPPVSKIAGSHIRKIRVTLRKDRMLQQRKKAIMDVAKAIEKESGWHAHIAIDVDPS